jgi:hypothetical protein
VLATQVATFASGDVVFHDRRSGDAQAAAEFKAGSAAFDPPPGTLTRWEPRSGTWEPLPLRPAPPVDQVTGLVQRVVERPHLDASGPPPAA